MRGDYSRARMLGFGLRILAARRWGGAVFPRWFPVVMRYYRNSSSCRRGALLEDSTACTELVPKVYRRGVFQWNMATSVHFTLGKTYFGPESSTPDKNRETLTQLLYIPVAWVSCVCQVEYNLMAADTPDLDGLSLCAILLADGP